MAKKCAACEKAKMQKMKKGGSVGKPKMKMGGSKKC